MFSEFGRERGVNHKKGTNRWVLLRIHITMMMLVWMQRGLMAKDVSVSVLVAKIHDMEHKMLDSKLVLVDDDGTHLTT